LTAKDDPPGYSIDVRMNAPCWQESINQNHVDGVGICISHLHGLTHAGFSWVICCSSLTGTISSTLGTACMHALGAGAWSMEHGAWVKRCCAFVGLHIHIASDFSFIGQEIISQDLKNTMQELDYAATHLNLNDQKQRRSDYLESFPNFHFPLV